MSGSFHNAAMFLHGTRIAARLKGAAALEYTRLHAARASRAAALGCMGCSIGLHGVACGAAHMAS